MTVIVNEGNDVELDSLLRHVSVMLPELPYEVALDMVRERYIELARKSGILRWYYELPIQKDVTNYFIEPPAGYEVYGIVEYGELFRNTWWPWAESPHYWNIAWGYRMRALSNTQIMFERAPTRDETGRYIRTVVIPTSCATSIPSGVATSWGRGIAAGAVATGLLMPSRAWSNPGLAQKHEIDFNRAVLGAKNLVLTERGTKPAQFRPIRIL